MDYTDMTVAQALQSTHFIVTPELQVLTRTFHPDERLLQKLRSKMWDAPSLHELKYFVFNNELEAYETPKGLILLETLYWARGGELRIYGMVGRDILTPGRVEPIIEDLKVLARHKKCSMIGGEGVPKGWLKAAPRLGFQPVSTHFVMELEDGQA